MGLFSPKQPRFSNGELDLWPVAKDNLPNQAAIDTLAKWEIEERRDSLINRLGGYAVQSGTWFYITHPDNVRSVDGHLHDFWGLVLHDDDSTSIQVPRHIVAARPEIGQAIEFRPEVPAFVIIGSMAHELAHRDRALRDPERYRAIFTRQDNRHKIDSSIVRHEEIATDVEAYEILQAEGVPLTTHDYIATVPQPPDYHQELADLIEK